MAIILAVSVNANGTIYENPTGGITVKKLDTGGYELDYSGQFTQPPVVVTTLNYPRWDCDWSDHGGMKDNSVIVSVTVNRAIILTGRSGLISPLDRNFTAILVGNVSSN
ncbi:hypothetical protein [Photorhabdus sp. SF281]|uniref:hypothetical protein n=1 Tax=Photorhabdus sp. SF281 TaxID=3459527 RepID=UPI0040442EEB